MANTRSARKRIRANERKHVRNRTVRSAVRTKVTKARRVLLNPAEGADAAEDLRAAIQSLDRAAEKGVIHRNNARRRKSRLASMAARLQAAGAEGAGQAAAARSTAAGGAKGRSAKSAAKGASKRTSKTSKTAKTTKPAAKAPAASSSRASAKTSRAKR